MRLTPDMKRAMLEDARSAARREAFRAADRIRPRKASLDDYLKSLDNLQKLFGPFQQSRRPPRAGKNKL